MLVVEIAALLFELQLQPLHVVCQLLVLYVVFLLYVVFSSIRADVLAHTCLGLGSGALFITSTLYKQILTRRASMILPVPEPEPEPEYESENEPETITEPNSDDSDVPNEIVSPDTDEFDDMPALIPITQDYFKKDLEIIRLLELIRERYQENNIILGNYQAIPSESYVQTEPVVQAPVPVVEPAKPVVEPVQVQEPVQAEPVVEPVQAPVPVVEPAKPVVEPVVQAEPVVQSVQVQAPEAKPVQAPEAKPEVKPVNSVVQVGTNQELLSKYSNERRLSFCYPC